MFTSASEKQTYAFSCNECPSYLSKLLCSNGTLSFDGHKACESLLLQAFHFSRTLQADARTGWVALSLDCEGSIRMDDIVFSLSDLALSTAESMLNRSEVQLPFFQKKITRAVLISSRQRSWVCYYCIDDDQIFIDLEARVHKNQRMARFTISHLLHMPSNKSNFFYICSKSIGYKLFATARKSSYAHAHPKTPLQLTEDRTTYAWSV